MGRDKAFLEIDGQPLWQRQLRTLHELRPCEVFIAGPMRNEWRDCNVIADATPDAGPLGGIVPALRQSSQPLVLVLAVDLPRMTVGYLRGLLALCSEFSGIIPQDDTRFQPLAAIYPTAAGALAQRCLGLGDSMQRFASLCVEAGLMNEQRITAHERSLFLNMNTPEDLLTVTNA